MKEFTILGVEGKEFQRINQRKERFSQMVSKTFDAGKALQMDLG